MLFAIGAVLSVLLFLFPGNLALALGACAAWILAATASGIDLFFRVFLRKKQLDEETEEGEKDRFLSDVAHELKTPLAVIRGNAEILADGVVPAEEYPAYCRRILRETDAMSRLVGDLLDLSRLRTGKVRFEPRDVDLAYLASSLCESLAPVGEKKGVFVAFESRCSLPVLWLDYDRIRQLAVIFLDNGIKHTPEGGTVTLFLDREGDTVLLGVRDTGHGISPEDLPHVFDRFYKADPQRGGLEVGSGIGLSLAVQIARLHGGRVDVVSEIGKGTCFTARLPLRECKETVES
ncbi:MAG: HAMP domain-containing histidine kinase [Clostridia bacterium]|nr:HAMP domain-containing histidine kinase [Clostridia bacterium]